MNQLIITFFITGAISVLVFILLLIIAVILQFRKQHFGFHQKGLQYVSGFRRQLLYAEVRAQENVFSLIAREIHDNIGLSLTSIKLFLHSLRPRNNPDEAQRISGSVHLLGRVMDQLRHLCRSMNGDLLEDQGLVNALRQEVQRINQLNQLQIVLRVEGETVNFDTKKELVVLRMIQESINNILKHARARIVEIHLRFANNRLLLNVSDDGIGMRPVLETQAPGCGLINLRKRAEMLAGQCTVISSATRGTTIAISIPINQ
ncbi:MAG: sensor histidine kinase [Pseudobacter sp.]|uniref:sensor histidine kinase n=1 Tax=Pseudobacter sp. TaxID=2045420 RepID=UPI003F822FDA